MKKLVGAIFLMLSLQVSAQVESGKLKIGAHTGYSLYTHKELKAMNRNVLKNLPFEAHIIDNFEPEFTFGYFVQYEVLPRFYFGPSYDYLYTGSRLGTRDYSGIYSFDQYLNAHQLGLKFNYQLIPSGLFSLGLELNSGACFTDWKTDSHLIIGDTGEISNQQINRYRGTSWYISPGLKAGVRIIPAVTLTGSALYNFDVLRKYKYIENNSLTVVTKPNWSGLRFNLGVEFNLVNRHENEQ